MHLIEKRAALVPPPPVGMDACRHDSRFDVMPATQITLRNVDPELSRRLRAVSAERGESLNSTVLRLLKDAVGVEPFK